MIRRIYLVLVGITLILSSACGKAPNKEFQPSVQPSIPPLPTAPSVGQPYPSGSAQPYPYPIPQSTSQTSTLAAPQPEPQSYSSAYPQPSDDPAAPIATRGSIPTPDNSTGVVTGRLLANGKPALNVLLFLALVKVDENNIDVIAGYSRQTAPKAFVGQEGLFVFNKVPPARYGIVLDTGIGQYLLHFPKDPAEQLLFNLEAGKIIDLGTLDYSDLPLLVK